MLEYGLSYPGPQNEHQHVCTLSIDTIALLASAPGWSICLYGMVVDVRSEVWLFWELYGFLQFLPNSPMNNPLCHFLWSREKKYLYSSIPSGLTAKIFFRSEAMLMSTLSSIPYSLAMNGYVARISIDNTWKIISAIWYCTIYWPYKEVSQHKLFFSHTAAERNGLINPAYFARNG